MTTLYVAGPMTGLPDYNYPAFHGAATALRDAGYDVLNPAEIEDPSGGKQPWEWYIRRSLVLVLRADATALLPGWERSRGVNLELTVARALGMRTASVDDWLSWTREVQMAVRA